MIRGIIFVIAGAALSCWREAGSRSKPAGGTWRFVVSGDSRNCGDVVMPGLRERRRKIRPVLLAFGRICGPSTLSTKTSNTAEYRETAIDCGLRKHCVADFIDSQIAPFGSIPFFVALGITRRFRPEDSRRLSSAVCRLADTPCVARATLGTTEDHR